MKGKKIILSALMLGAVASLASCDKEEEVASYSVTFKNGDTIISTDTVKEGNYFKIPQNPTKDGYVFAGWDMNGDNVADQVVAATADVTYNALFIDSQLAKTVTFKADGTEVAKVYYAEDVTSIVEPSVPEKEGYVGSWEEYRLDGNIEVNAVYTLAEYTVTFKADGVVVGQPQKYTINNKTIQVPLVPEKEGYDGTWEPYTLTTGDVVVNAVYTVKNLTLANIVGNYVVDGVNIVISEENVKVGSNYTYVAQGQTTDDNPYYYVISGDILTLYDYTGAVTYSFKYSLGKLYNYIPRESLGYVGTFKYVADNATETLTVTADSVVYDNGIDQYTNYYVGENNSQELIFIIDGEKVTFTMDSNCDFICDGKTFVKEIPEEYLGLYSFYNNYIYITPDSPILMTEDGITLGDYSYTYDSETQSFDDTYSTYKKTTKLSSISQSFYGTYRSKDKTIVLSADGYFIDGSKVENVAVYEDSGDIATSGKYTFIVLDDFILEVYISKWGTSFSSNNVQYYLSYEGDTTNTTMPESWAGISGVLLDCNGTKIKVSADSVECSLSGYESPAYFYSDDKLYLFTDNTYKLSDQLVFELGQDGNSLVNDGNTYTPFNIDVTTLHATYSDGVNEIVVSADGINYNGQLYADYTVKAYDIKLSDEITLTYDENENTLSDGSSIYSKVINIPAEWVGEYAVSYDPNVKYIITSTGITFTDGFEDLSCKIKSLNEASRTIELSYTLYGSWVINFTLIVSEDFNSLEEIDEYGSINIYSKPSDDEPSEDVNIPAEWIGTYSGGDYKLEITEAYVELTQLNWGSSSRDFTIEGNNLTVVLEYTNYKMVYDATNEKFVLDVDGTITELYKENSSTVEEPTTVMPTEWIGTYAETVFSGVAVISDTTVTISSTEYEVVSITGNELQVSDGLMVHFLVFSEDGSFTLDGDLVYYPVEK